MEAGVVNRAATAFGRQVTVKHRAHHAEGAVIPIKKRAATLADAWVPGPTASLEKLLAAQKQYRAELAAAGKDPAAAPTPITREVIVAEARELTRDLGNTGIQRTQLTLQALQEVAHQEGQAIVCLFVSGHRGSKGANLTNELTESPHPPGGVAMEAS